MMAVTKPKFFIPVHGEYRHLHHHANLAKSLGMPEDNVLISEIGDVIEMDEEAAKVVDRVHTGSIFVDGLGVGDVGNVVLRDRKHLAEDGIIVVALSVDSVTKEVLSGPELISRGFVYVKESEEMFDEAREIACDILEKCYVTGLHDWSAVKARVRDGLSRHLYEQTGRSPMILPIILEI